MHPQRKPQACVLISAIDIAGGIIQLTQRVQYNVAAGLADGQCTQTEILAGLEDKSDIGIVVVDHTQSTATNNGATCTYKSVSLPWPKSEK